MRHRDRTARAGVGNQTAGRGRVTPGAGCAVDPDDDLHRNDLQENNEAK